MRSCENGSSSQMKLLRALLVLLILLFAVVGADPSKPFFDRLFDQYGLIRWGDERARLDNFAIHLMQDQKSVGYIFVYDGKNVCLGEAQARAIRAKRYIVEHRGVPWDRVIWRIDGYAGEFSTVLQPAPPEAQIKYPFLSLRNVLPEVHVAKNCQTRIAKIRRSKW